MMQLQLDSVKPRDSCQGNLAGAERELQAVLRTSPKEHSALGLLGVVRILQHREADGEGLFQQAIESKRDFASAHAHLGLFYSQSDRDAEAMPELQAAIRLDPGRTDASDALVHIFRAHAKDAASNGDPKQALGLLIGARKLAPKDPDVDFEFASAAFQISLFQTRPMVFAKMELHLNNLDHARTDLKPRARTRRFTK